MTALQRIVDLYLAELPAGRVFAWTEHDRDRIVALRLVLGDEQDRLEHETEWLLNEIETRAEALGIRFAAAIGTSENSDLAVLNARIADITEAIHTIDERIAK